MPEFRLETTRLVLRDWRDEDWAVFFHHTNTPAVMRWLGGAVDGAGEATVRERLSGYARDHGHTFWVVERKADGGPLSGELLGFCGLKKANQEGGPIGDFEIGWRLREDAWGASYAREAAEATLEQAFTRHAAPHVIALTVKGNRGSWGLMERLGMRRREDLDFTNFQFDPEDGTIIAYSIDAAKWRARPR